MATSGTVTFRPTRDDVIEHALKEIGVLAAGQSPSSDDLTDCTWRLNAMLKSWNNLPKMYLRETFEVTLTAGTESYTIGSGGDFNRDRPVRVKEARRIDSDGRDVAIDVVSRQEYEDLPTKDTQAPVNMVHYDPQPELGVLYVWPTGTTDNLTLSLTTQREIEDAGSASDNVDVPKECFRALYLNLAVNIWRMYFGTEYQLPVDILAAAKSARDEWEAHEEEGTSLFIMPNMRF